MSNWENIFKDRLADAGLGLPEEGWQALLSRRAEQTRRKKQKRALLWALPAVAAATLALVFIPRGEDDAPVVLQSVPSPFAEAILPPETISSPETDPLPSGVSTSETTVNSTRTRKDKSKDPVVLSDFPNTEAAPSSQATVSQPTSDGPEREAPSPTPTIEAESATSSAPTQPSYETILQEEGHSASTRPGRKTSLGAGSLLAALGQEQHAGLYPSRANTVIPETVSGSTYHLGYGASDNRLIQSHSRPVEVGLTASIPLAGRWSLMTGAEYALYKSRLGYSAFTMMTQKAHYLGIPLRLDYDLVRRNRFRLYMGAGAKVDWGIAARLDGEKIDPDGFGLSLLGVGGLQWNVTGPLGLYLEPRFNWFLSEPEGRLMTFRTESPFRFTLSAGVRIDL